MAHRDATLTLPSLFRHKMLTTEEQTGLDGLLKNVRTDDEIETILYFPTDLPVYEIRKNFSGLLRFLRSCSADYTETQSIMLDMTVTHEGRQLRLSIGHADEIQKYKQYELLSVLNKDRCEMMHKDKEGAVIFSRIGCKTKKSRETKLEVSDELLRHVEQGVKFFRFKKRFSFTSKEGDFRVDMSMVKSSERADSSMRASNLLSSPERLEVEVEFLKPTEVTPDQILQIILRVRAVLTLTPLPLVEEESTCYEEYYGCVTKGLKGIPRRGEKSLWLGPKVVSLTRENIFLLQQNDKNYTVTMKTDGERALGYIHDQKLLWISSDWKFRNSGFVTLSAEWNGTIVDGEVVHCLSNKELVFHYVIFDIYYKNHEDVRCHPFDPTRITFIKEVVSALHLDPMCPHPARMAVVTKDFFPLSLMASMLADTKKSSYQTDGLIFTPREPLTTDAESDVFICTGVTLPTLLKWKPHHLNTVDFLVRIDPVKNRASLLTGRKPKYDIFDMMKGSPHRYLQDVFVPINRTKVYDFFGGDEEKTLRILESASFLCPLPRVEGPDGKKRILCENRDEILDGMVVEMYYNVQDAAWKARNVRVDKKEGNDDRVAQRIWDNFFPGLSETDLLNFQELVVDAKIMDGDDDIYYTKTSEERRKDSLSIDLRSFHNSIKARLIQDAVRPWKAAGSVLEMGVGKGGDLRKWADTGRVHTFVGIDKSLDNVQNGYDGACVRMRDCQRSWKRKNGKLFDAYFLQGDCGRNLRFGESTTIPSHHRLMRHLLGTDGDDATSSYPVTTLAYHGFAVISVQFALHYFFESEDILDGFVRNVTENLAKEGGVLIGTCYEGWRVKELLGDRLCASGMAADQKTLLWEIVSHYDPSVSASCGQGISVYMESIGQRVTEYLVDFNLLAAKLAPFGIFLESKTPFCEYEKASALTPEMRRLSFLNVAFCFRRRA